LPLCPKVVQDVGHGIFVAAALGYALGYKKLGRLLKYIGRCSWRTCLLTDLVLSGHPGYGQSWYPNFPVFFGVLLAPKLELAEVEWILLVDLVDPVELLGLVVDNRPRPLPAGKMASWGAGDCTLDRRGGTLGLYSWGSLYQRLNLWVRRRHRVLMGGGWSRS
jgi:hypothetical protein